jgi:hypothetical protein
MSRRAQQVDVQLSLPKSNGPLYIVVSGDGAYDTYDIWSLLKERVIEGIIPPQENAITAMFRYKKIFGAELLSRKLKSQKTEAAVKVICLNKMTGIGMPVSKKIA